MCFGGLQWSYRFWKDFETETKKLEKEIKINLRELDCKNREKQLFYGGWQKNYFFQFSLKPYCRLRFYRKSNTCDMEFKGVLFGKK